MSGTCYVEKNANHFDDMALAFVIWMCTLPLVALLIPVLLSVGLVILLNRQNKPKIMKGGQEPDVKSGKIHLPNLAYIAAFIIGAILFVTIWNTLFGAESILMLLAGMTGVVAAVIVFWIWNEDGKHDNRGE